MKIYEVAVKKPISTILIFVGVMVMGIYSLNNLAIDMYPDIDMPIVSVMTTYAGANAGDIETNITRILEDNLNTVSNLKKLTSKSQDNMSTITLQFEWGADLNEAANDIRDVIGRVGSLLPEDADAPIIMKFSSSMMPVLVMSATADESFAGLYKILDDKLVNVLNRIDGVGSVTIMGQPVREIQVNVDPQKLEAYNISVEALGAIIAAENVNVPGGTLDIGNNTYNIKSDNEFTDSDMLRSVVVGSYRGRTVYLTDVATIKDTLEKQTLNVQTNGARAMQVMVQKQSGANSVAIVEAVEQAMATIMPTLPPDVKVLTIMDSSESIVNSINTLTETIMYAFIFVTLVVLFFLGRWRATFIVCLTIPVSLVVAFIYLLVTGSTLNIISLSSLSIAIGLVVDDAIVVLENITKHIERGSTPREAAISGTNEVWLAVIATTLVIFAVFMPLTLVGGQAGILFKELGWIVSLVVGVSMIAAITLTPMLSAMMLKAEHKHQYKGLGVIFRPVDKFLDNLDVLYANMVTWAVRHRAVVLITALLTFVASLFLMSRVPSEFMTESDTGSMTAEVKLQQNVSLPYTTVVARHIDSIIYANYPEIEILSTRAGQMTGWQALMGNSGTYIINYTMRLPSPSHRERSVFEIADLLRQDLARIPEVRQYTVSTSDAFSSFGGGSPIAVKVFGHDVEQTNAIASDIRNQLAQTTTMRDVKLSRDELRPEYNIVFDRNRLAVYGLNSATAAQFVRNRINGLIASKYREQGDEYNIMVRYAEPFRTTLDDIENIIVYNQRGDGIRIGEIATIEEVFSPPAIEREDRQRVVSVNASLGDGVALGTAIADVKEVLARVEIPEGVSIQIGGSYEDQQESFGDLYTLIILIVLLVYIVMATQFESFLSPFIIILSLFFAFTGVFLALWITNTPLGLLALLGAIMLIGIAVKNGIVMVDYTNLLRERGYSINHAVIASGKSRLRPVLMTSIATILGMLPLAIGAGEGSEIWRPMAIAIIGGLTVATILTLIVVPVLYSVFGSAGLTKEKKELRRIQKEHREKDLRKMQIANRNAQLKKE